MHPEAATRPQATLAEGFVWLALMVVTSTACRALPRPVASVPVAKPVCTAPIEVVEASGFVRVGCADEAHSWGCSGVEPGDRVTRVAGCQVHQDGMRAGWMLSWGLPLDVNHRSAAELAQVAGISAALAERIVAFRQAHGPFAEVRDLLAVRGVGKKSLSRLAPALRAG